ncbi:MAG: DUF6489 family protein [Pseudomonadota bacterium]
MKVRIDIDCTPEEARAFFGLPDVKPMQEAAMAEVTARLKEALGAIDPETMIKTWLPGSIEGWERMQKMFWGQAGMGGKEGKKT